MKPEELSAAVTKIRNSSAYAAGDATTFRVPFRRHEIELPAPSDPFAYFDTIRGKLGTRIPEDGRVAIIGAGYGGLCATVLMMGAREVIAIEPRDRFRAGLDAVVGVLDDIYEPDKVDTARVFAGWPAAGHISSLGQFDLIVWPESFEECPYPAATLEVALKLLAPGGALIVEVIHGETATLPAGKVNAWRPTTVAFAELIKRVNTAGPDASTPGRGTNRTIYRIIAHAPKAADIKKPELNEIAPRQIPARTLHQVGFRQPIPEASPVIPKVEAKPEDEPVVILDEEKPKASKPGRGRPTRDQ